MHSNLAISPIVDDCRQMVLRIDQVRFKHYLREVNRCADGLARLGGQQGVHFSIFDYPPVEIQSCFDCDKAEMFLNRCCPKPIP